MKVKVVYYTKSGHTEKIAKAIGTELGAVVANMDTALTEEVDVLFLGASVYKMGVDKSVLKFIDTLDANKVGNVVLFSTSAMADSGYPKLKKRLLSKGINVHQEHFHCKGEFMMLNKNRPNRDDTNEAKKFARRILKK